MAPKVTKSAEGGLTTLQRAEQKSLTEMLDGREQIPELSWDDLLATIGETDELGDAADLGGGFHLLKKDDKARLVGTPFVVLYFRVNTKWSFGPGISAMIQTATPIAFEGQVYNRFVVNDGSTGLAQQLIDYKTSTGKNGPILCKRGLRVSEYEVMEDDPENAGEKRNVIDPATGKKVIGKTFYIDTSL